METRGASYVIFILADFGLIRYSQGHSSEPGNKSTPRGSIFFSHLILIKNSDPSWKRKSGLMGIAKRENRRSAHDFSEINIECYSRAEWKIGVDQTELIEA
jgi:hypothetical protein